MPARRTSPRHAPRGSTPRRGRSATPPPAGASSPVNNTRRQSRASAATSGGSTWGRRRRLSSGSHTPPPNGSPFAASSRRNEAHLKSSTVERFDRPKGPVDDARDGSHLSNPATPRAAALKNEKARSNSVGGGKQDRAFMQTSEVPKVGGGVRNYALRKFRTASREASAERLRMYDEEWTAKDQLEREKHFAERERVAFLPGQNRRVFDPNNTTVYRTTEAMNAKKTTKAMKGGGRPAWSGGGIVNHSAEVKGLHGGWGSPARSARTSEHSPVLSRTLSPNARVRTEPVRLRSKTPETASRQNSVATAGRDTRFSPPPRQFPGRRSLASASYESPTAASRRARATSADTVLRQAADVASRRSTSPVVRNSRAQSPTNKQARPMAMRRTRNSVTTAKNVVVKTTPLPSPESGPLASEAAVSPGIMPVAQSSTAGPEPLVLDKGPAKANAGVSGGSRAETATPPPPYASPKAAQSAKETSADAQASEEEKETPKGDSPPVQAPTETTTAAKTAAPVAVKEDKQHAKPAAKEMEEKKEDDKPTPVKPAAATAKKVAEEKATPKGDSPSVQAPTETTTATKTAAPVAVKEDKQHTKPAAKKEEEKKEDAKPTPVEPTAATAKKVAEEKEEMNDEDEVPEAAATTTKTTKASAPAKTEEEEVRYEVPTDEKPAPPPKAPAAETPPSSQKEREVVVEKKSSQRLKSPEAVAKEAPAPAPAVDETPAQAAPEPLQKQPSTRQVQQTPPQPAIQKQMSIRQQALEASLRLDEQVKEKEKERVPEEQLQKKPSSRVAVSPPRAREAVDEGNDIAAAAAAPVQKKQSSRKQRAPTGPQALQKKQSTRSTSPARQRPSTSSEPPLRKEPSLKKAPSSRRTVSPPASTPPEAPLQKKKSTRQTASPPAAPLQKKPSERRTSPEQQPQAQSTSNLKKSGSSRMRSPPVAPALPKVGSSGEVRTAPAQRRASLRRAEPPADDPIPVIQIPAGAGSATASPKDPALPSPRDTTTGLRGRVTPQQSPRDSPAGSPVSVGSGRGLGMDRVGSSARRHVSPGNDIEPATRAGSPRGATPPPPPGDDEPLHTKPSIVRLPSAKVFEIPPRVASGRVARASVPTTDCVSEGSDDSPRQEAVRQPRSASVSPGASSGRGSSATPSQGERPVLMSRAISRKKKGGGGLGGFLSVPSTRKPSKSPNMMPRDLPSPPSRKAARQGSGSGLLGVERSMRRATKSPARHTSPGASPKEDPPLTRTLSRKRSARASSSPPRPGAAGGDGLLSVGGNSLVRKKSGRQSSMYLSPQRSMRSPSPAAGSSANLTTKKSMRSSSPPGLERARSNLSRKASGSVSPGRRGDGAASPASSLTVPGSLRRASMRKSSMRKTPSVRKSSPSAGSVSRGMSMRKSSLAASGFGRTVESPITVSEVNDVWSTYEPASPAFLGAGSPRIIMTAPPPEAASPKKKASVRELVRKDSLDDLFADDDEGSSAAGSPSASMGMSISVTPAELSPIVATLVNNYYFTQADAESLVAATKVPESQWTLAHCVSNDPGAAALPSVGRGGFQLPENTTMFIVFATKDTLAAVGAHDAAFVFKKPIRDPKVAIYRNKAANLRPGDGVDANAAMIEIGNDDMLLNLQHMQVSCQLTSFTGAAAGALLSHKADGWEVVRMVHIFTAPRSRIARKASVMKKTPSFKKGGGFAASTKSSMRRVPSAAIQRKPSNVKSFRKTSPPAAPSPPAQGGFGARRERRRRAADEAEAAAAVEDEPRERRRRRDESPAEGDRERRRRRDGSESPAAADGESVPRDRRRRSESPVIDPDDQTRERRRRSESPTTRDSEPSEHRKVMRGGVVMSEVEHARQEQKAAQERMNFNLQLAGGGNAYRERSESPTRTTLTRGGERAVQGRKAVNAFGGNAGLGGTALAQRGAATQEHQSPRVESPGRSAQTDVHGMPMFREVESPPPREQSRGRDSESPGAARRESESPAARKERNRSKFDPEAHYLSTYDSRKDMRSREKDAGPKNPVGYQPTGRDFQSKQAKPYVRGTDEQAEARTKGGTVLTHFAVAQRRDPRRGGR